MVDVLSDMGSLALAVLGVSAGVLESGIKTTAISPVAVIAKMVIAMSGFFMRLDRFEILQGCRHVLSLPGEDLR